VPRLLRLRLLAYACLIEWLVKGRPNIALKRRLQKWLNELVLLNGWPGLDGNHPLFKEIPPRMLPQ
jgi:hypothetical protein